MDRCEEIWTGQLECYVNGSEIALLITEGGKGLSYAVERGTVKTFEYHVWLTSQVYKSTRQFFLPEQLLASPNRLQLAKILSRR